MKQTRRRWTIGAALMALPLAAALPGCGGGNNGTGFFHTTPTPTPGAPVEQFFSAPINFGNGQGGNLNLIVRGNTASGNLVVNPRPMAVTGTRAFTFAIPAGTYGVSGSFTPPRTFQVSGTFPAPLGNFNINGVIPVGTQAGSFTVSANGQTATGIIPADVTPGVTPTPRPGSTPTPRPGGTPTPTPSNAGRLTATFSNSTINGNDAAFNASQGVGVIGPASGNFSAVYQASGTVVRNFAVQAINTVQGGGGGFTPFTVGQVLGFSSTGIGAPGQAQILFTSQVGATTGQWSARSGRLVITAITSTSISYRLENVRFEPGIASQAGTGGFTLNGTGQVTK